MHIMSILCLAADVVISETWPILFKVQTLWGYMYYPFICEYFLFMFEFCSCFFNTEARTLTSADHASCLPAQWAMKFGHMVWGRVVVIFRWRYFNTSIDAPLILSSSSFLTELFDLNRWPVKFFRPSSGEAHRWFICFTSHSQCCFPSLLRFNLWVKNPPFNSLSFNSVKDQLSNLLFLFAFRLLHSLPRQFHCLAN